MIIEAMKQIAERGEPVAWMPESTAPKDGSRFLAMDIYGVIQEVEFSGIYAGEHPYWRNPHHFGNVNIKGWLPKARLQATTPPTAPVQEPVGRTDQQIVDQTEELAVWLLSWGFNRQPETDTPMRESAHPMAQRCWSAACHIQEMLTNTDPENSVAELDVDATPPAAQPAPIKVWEAEGYDALMQQVEMVKAENQRLSALVRAQQITIDKLEATLFDLSYCNDAENLYDLAVKADNGGQP